jgi:hypothetical protein
MGPAGPSTLGAFLDSLITVVSAAVVIFAT